MFRRYPYWGWLTMAVVLLMAAGIRQLLRSRLEQPEHMTKVISRDLEKRQKALDRFLMKKGLIQKMFSDKLTAAEVESISNEPFNIYAFEDNNILLFWNSNIVVSNCDSMLEGGDKTLYRRNGVYYKQCFWAPYLKPNQYLVAMFPIVTRYPISNAYLKSGFAAADYIPLSTKITEVAENNSYPVKNKKGDLLFYVSYDPDDQPHLMPDALTNFCLITGSLLLFLWFQLIALWLSRIRPVAGVAVIVGIALLVLLSLDWVLPALNLDNADFFSPTLYASGRLYPSLGHLLIHLTCYLWVVVFCVWRFRRRLIGELRISEPLQLVIITGASLFLVAASLGAGDGVKSIILDSQISFDLSNFYVIGGYTITGIVILGIIPVIGLLVIYIVNKQIQSLEKHMVKYVIILLVTVVYYFVGYEHEDNYELWIIVWLLITLALLDYKPFPKKQFNNVEKLLYSCVYLSLAVTPLLRNFIKEKEERNRVSFVQQVVKERDEMLEYLFPGIAQNIAASKVLEQYLLAPAAETRGMVNSEVTSRYLRGHLNRYDVDIYLYDGYGTPLFNPDSISLVYFNQLSAQDTGALHYIKNPVGSYHYLAPIQVRRDSLILGTLVLDFYLKHAPNNSLYPELLQPANLKQSQRFGQYTYAVYVDQSLVEQTTDHPFPLYIRNDTLKAGGKSIYEREDYRVLRYKTDDKTTVSIIHYARQQISWITTFSCMIITMVALGLVIISLGYLFLFLLQKHRPFVSYQPTLRGRIFFAIPAILFLSFLIIGITTWSIFEDRNVASNKLRLRNTMHVVERLVQEYLAERKVETNHVTFSAVASMPEFRQFIASISENRNADINVYDSLGTLITTSQEDIYNKGLLAGIMNPDAYHTLAEEEKAVELQEENIGTLSYLSCYVPLRNEFGKAYGYLNVPYFSSGRELSTQISNVLVALIDVYVFMLLVSIAVAFVVSNRLTKGLKLITDHFERYDIGQNAPIKWEHEDEIGIMVNAYNANLRRVKEAIEKLAKSERESAWREMARQVAHEIKNPLTPMKLNIQYLQMALNNNHPNLEELTSKVTTSLLEQIENLAYIATAFSDFAKMPEAKPEPVILNEILGKAVELYQKNPAVTVSLRLPEQNLPVFIDRSQLLRVLNNLLQNAVDAIPDERQGMIEVTLQQEGEEAVIKVTDNGVGIPEDVIAKIFSPYFTTKGSGTGLGLAMTRKIIEFWKGTIYFETKEGVGTTFFIKLPLLHQ